MNYLASTDLVRRLSLLLASISVLLLLGCNVNSVNPTTAIAWSNMAISYPIWATLMPTTEGSRVSAVDMTNGEVMTLATPGVTFTGIHGIPSSDGDFVISTWNGSSSSIFIYNFSSKRRNVVFEGDRELRAPFILNGDFCALHPRSKTSKQSYNYELVCKNSDSIGSIIIETYDSYVFSGDLAVFLDVEPSDTSIYIIRYSNRGLEMRSLEVPHDRFLRLLGFNGNVLYFYSIKSGGRVTVYRWIDGNLVEDNENVAQSVVAARGGVDQKFLIADQDHIFAARINDDQSGIKGLIWNSGGRVFEAVINTYQSK